MKTVADILHFWFYFIYRGFWFCLLGNDIFLQLTKWKYIEKMVELAFIGNTARKLQRTNSHLFSIITKKRELEFELLCFIYDSIYDLKYTIIESFFKSTFQSTS